MWFKKAFSQRKSTSEITNAWGKRATEVIKQGHNFTANELFDNLFLGPVKQSLAIKFLHFQSLYGIILLLETTMQNEKKQYKNLHTFVQHHHL